jgi:beta-lactam-binding protein with PASTA domain
MSENQEEVLEVQEETQEQTTNETEVVEEKPDTGASVAEDGTIKLDLGKLNKPQEDAIQEQSADDSDVTVGESENAADSEEVAEEVRDTEEAAARCYSRRNKRNC